MFWDTWGIDVFWDTWGIDVFWDTWGIDVRLVRTYINSNKYPLSLFWRKKMYTPVHPSLTI